MDDKFRVKSKNGKRFIALSLSMLSLFGSSAYAGRDENKVAKKPYPISTYHRKNLVSKEFLIRAFASEIDCIQLVVLTRYPILKSSLSDYKVKLIKENICKLFNNYIFEVENLIQKVGAYPYCEECDPRLFLILGIINIANDKKIAEHRGVLFDLDGRANRLAHGFYNRLSNDKGHRFSYIISELNKLYGKNKQAKLIDMSQEGLVY